MNQELWKRVKAVAADAWDQPLADRAAFVAQACGADDGLRQHVLSLVEAMAQAGDRFETPALAMPGAAVAAADAIGPLPSSLVGERLGPWALVRELGHGGMGTVYLAERAGGEFAQRVAIKVVRGSAADDLLLRRFREERRILATLDHPHIARLIDGGATPLGLPYVVMEYVDGLPIDVYCESQRLDAGPRIALFRKVCAAVQYSHQHLIVHRDIKASNILVTPDGVPKLLDFGIAKILEADRPSETTLFRMITPDSASPEQIRGEPVTTSTDVYALGVLLYRLLTKRSPYRLNSTSETELIQAICDQQPTPPSAIVPAIDPDLDHVVLTALRKEPERRYTGADGLSDDLQRYLEGRPVSATPDSRLYRARKFVARHRVGVAAAAALVLTVIIGSMSTLWQARVAERERARAERQFLAVRTLATSVLGELHDAVNGLAGSTGARELLLRRATEYLDGLSREAGEDAALRRELADGYRRLAQVQGTSGMSNVGDRQAAITSYRKALAVLQPLADATGEPRDRLRLAGTYVSLAGLERDRDTRTTLNRQALALLEGLPPAARETPEAVNARVRVWHAMGRLELDGKQYANAKVSFENEVAAAEAAIKLSPDSATAIRNLALAQQQLGTTLEMLGRVDDAIACYRRALALDRQRVERLGGTAEARLDLSFSYGAVGTALLAKGDVAGAREHYRQAIELRQAVLLEDPENDWARKGLALGAQRMAFVQGRGGDLEDAVRWLERGLEIFRQRAAAHPERDRLWLDLATAIFESATEGVLWLEAPAVPPGTRLRFARHLDGLLEDLAQLRARWARERRATVMPPPDDDLQRLRERVRRLLPASASRTAP